MKIRNAVKILAVILPLLVVLRVAQYIFCIADDGFYILDTPWQKVLAQSAYWVFAAGAAILLPLRRKKYQYCDCELSTVLHQPAVRWTALALALTLAVEGSVRMVCSVAEGSFDIVAVFAWLAAFAFTALFLKLWDRVWWCALLPIIYATVRLAAFFFSTFKYIRASENIFDVFLLAALVLMLLSLARLAIGADFKVGQMAWNNAVFCLAASVAVLARGIVLLTGLATWDGIRSLCNLPTDLAFTVLAVVVLLALPLPSHDNAEKEQSNI